MTLNRNLAVRRPQSPIGSKRAAAQTESAPSQERAVVQRTPAQEAARVKEKARVAALTQFAATEGFKTTNLRIELYFGADGLIFPKFDVKVLRGAWDREDVPTTDLMTYSPETVVGIYSRLGMLTGSTSVKMDKRMPVNSHWVLYASVGSNKDGLFRCSLRDIQLGRYNRGAKHWDYASVMRSENERLIPIVRRLKRARTFLLGALVGMPPTPKVSSLRQLSA